LDYKVIMVMQALHYGNIYSNSIAFF
jgi:hypothetical protein